MRLDEGSKQSRGGSERNGGETYSRAKLWRAVKKNHKARQSWLRFSEFSNGNSVERFITRIKLLCITPPSLLPSAYVIIHRGRLNRVCGPICRRFSRGKSSRERAAGRERRENEKDKRSLPRSRRGREGAPAGAGVIVDIQRGKYAISRAHKFSQSGESGPLPPRAWQRRYLHPGSRARSVNVTRVRARALPRGAHRGPIAGGSLSGNPGIPARGEISLGSRYRENRERGNTREDAPEV